MRRLPLWFTVSLAALWAVVSAGTLISGGSGWWHVVLALSVLGLALSIAAWRKSAAKAQPNAKAQRRKAP